jgi:hypothetical protein
MKNVCLSHGSSACQSIRTRISERMHDVPKIFRVFLIGSEREEAERKLKARAEEIDRERVRARASAEEAQALREDLLARGRKDKEKRDVNKQVSSILTAVFLSLCCSMAQLPDMLLSTTARTELLEVVDVFKEVVFFQQIPGQLECTV